MRPSRVSVKGIRRFIAVGLLAGLSVVSLPGEARAAIVESLGGATISHDESARTWTLGAGSASLTLSIDRNADYQLVSLESPSGRRWTPSAAADTWVVINGKPEPLGLRAANFDYERVTTENTGHSLVLHAAYIYRPGNVRVVRHVSIVDGSPTFEMWTTFEYMGTEVTISDLNGFELKVKDGTIRWVFSKTSPLGVRVAAFKAPTEEERARDFLWRCHAVVPRSGELMVWNRSHYEDVLVPPVNGWIDKDATARRYEQINAFEDLLTETGTQIVKCFLHISADEQKKRLQARIDDPTKHWKFSMGDLEVRKQWPQYMRAYERALAATSSAAAPWYVIPANDKLHRNLMIAELLVRTLKKMELAPPKANPALAGLLVE